MDAQISKLMEKNTSMRWIFNDSKWKFAADSPSDDVRKTRPEATKDVAGRIVCPTLVVDSEDDKSIPGQARELYEALHAPKTFMLFTNAEGAGEHCQEGAKMISNERVLDWLDETLRVGKKLPPKGPRIATPMRA